MGTRRIDSGPGWVVATSEVVRGLLLPQGVVAHLDATAAPNRDDVLRWAAMDSWHLTLAFYGQVDDRECPT